MLIAEHADLPACVFASPTAAARSAAPLKRPDTSTRSREHRNRLLSTDGDRSEDLTGPDSHVPGKAGFGVTALPGRDGPELEKKLTLAKRLAPAPTRQAAVVLPAAVDLGTVA